MRHERVIAKSIALVAGVACLACASANVKPTASAPDDLPKPSVIMVYDFAVDPSDVEGAAPSDDPPSQEELKLGRAAAKALSEKLVAQLANKGIEAQRAIDSDQAPLHAVLVKGQFIDVDEGSRLKRVVIGFGAGSSKLEARVQAYQVYADGIRRIAGVEADATGSRMPGMAVPVAAGAAMGRAVASLAISSGMQVAKEVRGGTDADAANMAEQIAKRIIAYYERHGWL